MQIARAAIVTLLLATAAHAADPLPTSDELQALADKKDWAGLLAGVSRVLPLKGPQTAAYDRVDLWMKKGEAQLQSKQFTPASQSFTKAAAETAVTPEQSDQAKALAELVKKSEVKGYKTPARLGPVQTFDVLDPAKRPDALAALFKSDSTDLTKQAEQVKASVEAKVLTDLVTQIADLRPLDRVVNKSADQSDTIEKAVAQHFADAVKTWSDTADPRLNQIKTEADVMVEQRTRDTANRITIRQRRTGVQPAQLAEVRKLMQQGEKLAFTYTAVEKAMSPAGQGVIKPAQQTIQTTYDLAKTLQSDALRPRQN